MTATLFDSLVIGDLKLANRVVMAPMTRARAGAEMLPNEMMAEYYAQRATAGLIITEGTVISPQANGWVHAPGLYTPEMVQGWQEITAKVHAAGGKIFSQLWHCGRASHSAFHGGHKAVAPSAIAINADYIHTPAGKQPHETPRALETAEIPAVIEEYVQAATNAKAAGFDGVEIHGANGYLIDSFLQSKTNQRTDQYGGSVEKRFQFLKEVVEAVVAVWGPDKVGVRISPNGVYNDMGSPDYQEQFLYVARSLNAYPLAYLHIMDGLGFGFHELGEPMTLAQFREVFDKPIIGNCGYEQATAETAIASGAADCIAFGRPFISNPDLVARFQHGWPLNDPAEVAVWYAAGETGYLDFPSYRG